MKKALFLYTGLSAMLVLTGCANTDNKATQTTASNQADTAKTTQSQTPQSQATQEQATSLPTITGVWIDVRSPDEYQTGHLVSAINIPIEQISGKIAQITTDKNTPIHLYCRSGRRAESARQLLIGMGYTNVINHGAFDELKQTYQSE